MVVYLCKNPGGALFHLLELTLLKFLQPNPVTLRNGDIQTTYLQSQSYFLRKIMKQVMVPKSQKRQLRLVLVKMFALLQTVYYCDVTCAILIVSV